MSRVSNKAPNVIDRHVGARVRMRRLLLGMSQDSLGQKLGVTFQQVQKYEKGTNRIGAGRLQDLSRVLDVTVDFFYKDAPLGDGPGAALAGFAEPGQVAYAPPPDISDYLSTPEAVQLNQAFRRVRDPKLRRRIADLVLAIAGEDEGTPPGS